VAAASQGSGGAIGNIAGIERDLKAFARKYPGIKLGPMAIALPGMKGRTTPGVIRPPWNPTYTEIGSLNADPVQATRNILKAEFIAQQASKWQFNKWLSPTLQAYAAMNIYLREYRRNFLVRGSINARAYWATKEGFETEVEVPDDIEGEGQEAEQAYRDEYKDVKGFIDRTNKRVRFKKHLRIAMVKRLIYGRAGFEIEWRGNAPSRLLSLDSQIFIGTEPIIDSNWDLRGFSYKGMGTSLSQPYYLPWECLYFTYNELEDDLQGLSAVEPILKEAQLDDKIVREDLTEAATTMWAGIVIWLLDRSKLPNLSDAEVQGVMDALIGSIQPGKQVATENVWTPVPVKVQVDLNALLAVQDSCERRIVGNLQVPRFMLNIERELNRATAYAELEAFVDGPVTDDQTEMAEQIEDRWYDLLIRAFYHLKPDTPHERLPCHVRHKWHEIRTTDWFQLIISVSTAYNAGWIDQEKAYEMMYEGQGTDFNPDDLRDEQGEFHAKLPPHATQPRGSVGQIGAGPGLGPITPPTLAGSIVPIADRYQRTAKLQLKGLLNKVQQGSMTEATALDEAGKICDKYLARIVEASKEEFTRQTGVQVEKMPPELEAQMAEWKTQTMKAFQLVLADAKHKSK
jgi:hypothetical protein